MKYHFVIFALGLLLGLFFSFMWSTLTIDTDLPTVSKKSPVALQKEVAKSEVNYAKNYDSLKNYNDKLNTELNGTRGALQIAKRKNASLQNEVFDLIEKRFDNAASDTTLNDSSCDSLIVTVEKLMQSSTEKDSLYETVTVNLESQVKNKDSTIVLKERQYQDIKSAFNESIDSQQALTDQNKFLHKQVKKQKFKSKFLSAALFIFAGVATNHLIQH